MRTMMLGFAAFAVLFTAQGDDSTKKERAALQGTWTITKFETGKGAQDGFNGATLTFTTDGKASMVKEGETKKGTYTLNPKAKPKQIDLTSEEDGHAMKGIYRLEKGNLTICITGGKDAERPTEFSAQEGTPNVLITLRRANK